MTKAIDSNISLFNTVINEIRCGRVFITYEDKGTYLLCIRHPTSKDIGLNAVRIDNGLLVNVDKNAKCQVFPNAMVYTGGFNINAIIK